MFPHPDPQDRCLGAAFRRHAFTIPELLVAMTLLIIITGIVVQVTNQTSKIWLSATARIQAFQEARAGFESLTRKLSQATLNTYYDYYDSNNNPRGQVTAGLSGNAAISALASFVPVKYDRYSELHFVCGQAQDFKLLSSSTNSSVVTQTHAVFFQAPLGYSASSQYQELDNALNACGYFLLFDDAKSSIPAHIVNSPNYKARYRFRLMEMTQPSEQLTVYQNNGPTHQNDWFANYAISNSRIIAENVIALVLLPKLPPSQDTQGVVLAPTYNYDSRVAVDSSADTYTISGTSTINGTRHAQLPPIMHVVMIVIDETSAARIQGSGTTPPHAIDFHSVDLFKDATKLDGDIQKVEDICNAVPGNLTGNTVHLTHRVFNTDIIMRDAKWSNN